MSLVRNKLFFVSFFFTTVLCSSEIVSGNFTLVERKALEQFRSLVSPHLNRDFMQKDEYLIRWIIDQDFNIEKAKKKLLASLKWRQENKIDSIFEDEDFTDLEKLCPYTNDGRDKVGKPVITVALGTCPIRRVVLSGNIDKLHRIIYFTFEAASSLVQDLQAEGKSVGSIIAIADVHNFNWREHACLRCISIGLEALTLYESYYPLYVSHVFIINVPRIAESLIPIALEFLSERTKKNLHIFGFNRQEWQPAILKFVASDQIESQFGGTKPRTKFVPFLDTRKNKLKTGIEMVHSNGTSQNN